MSVRDLLINHKSQMTENDRLWTRFGGISAYDNDGEPYEGKR